VCFALGFRMADGLALFSRRERFHGDPAQMRREATRWALRRLPEFHQRALRGERA
ncbi:ompetence-damaged protein, partial [Pseudomonas aeruginosa]|nr:ompetence-damaged protein [Pseudomonas aeruginosa]